VGSSGPGLRCSMVGARCSRRRAIMRGGLQAAAGEPTLPAGCGRASSLARGKRAGAGRCADAGPVVLMRSRLTDGRCSPRCADDMLEKAVSLRSCIHGEQNVSTIHSVLILIDIT
jgi:hypothetical protein